MQSNTQNSPSAMQQEDPSSRQLKFRIRRPCDNPNVDGEAPCGTSSETNSYTLESNLEDSSRISSSDRLKSPRPKKKSRRMPQHNSDGDEPTGSVSNQLVLYNPESSSTTQDITPVPVHNDYHASPYQNSSNRALPAVGAFTVQCADCFKWRLIPTKEKYEEIREHIMESPFTCKDAREWRPDITCDDPADISQDGSRVWAIDKPSIAQPPPGWERQLRIRGEGGTKFADVYYSAPTGKKLRSKVEIQKFLQEHPEYSEGVNLSQFSFQIPTPLQENYCRKRPKQSPSLDAASGSRALEPVEVDPISWILPTDAQHDEGSPLISDDGGPSSPQSFVQTSSPSQTTSSPDRKKTEKPRIYIKPHSSPSQNELP